MNDEYLDATVQRVLTEDFAEQGIDVLVRDSELVLRGTVQTEQRRDEIGRQVRGMVPDRRIRNEIEVAPMGPPDGSEDLS